MSQLLRSHGVANFPDHALFEAHVFYTCPKAGNGEDVTGPHTVYLSNQKRGIGGIKSRRILGVILWRSRP